MCCHDFHNWVVGFIIVQDTRFSPNFDSNATTIIMGRPNVQNQTLYVSDWWWCSSCQAMDLYTILSSLLKTQTFKWVGCNLPQSKQSDLLYILFCFASSTLKHPFFCICKFSLLLENLVMFITIYLFLQTWVFPPLLPLPIPLAPQWMSHSNFNQPTINAKSN